MAVNEQTSPELLLDISFPLSPRIDEYCQQIPLKGGTGPCMAYTSALAAEIEAAAPDFDGYTLVAAHLGGIGMPGMMRGDQIHNITRTMKRCFPSRPEHAELLVEFVPDFVTSDFLVNIDSAFSLRPSFDYVSAVARELISLGATFGYESFLDLKDLLTCRHITTFDLKLRYGLFYQTPRSIVFSIEQAFALNPSDIVLIPFVLHPELESARLMAAGELPQLDSSPERLGELRDTAVERLEQEGYLEYAPYHFARPGNESVYWLSYVNGADVLGVGLGARSYFEDMALINTLNFKEYVDSPTDPAITCAVSRILTEEEQANEKAARRKGMKA